MRIGKKVADAINRQIGHEFGASLQYVSIASYFGHESLPELSKFFHAQANEERDHALKFAKYLVDSGVGVVIPAIPAPKSGFKSAEEAFQASVDWEMTVTKQITAIVDLARAEKDHLTENFLHWFLTEQVEEVSTMEGLLAMVRRAGESGLFYVEDYLARRVPGTGGEGGA